jgi:hypothetical protein
MNHLFYGYVLIHYEHGLGITLIINMTHERGIDIRMTWINRPVIVKQDEPMWVHQLQSDKDIVAQLEAIDGLKDWAREGHPHLAPNALRDALQDEKSFYQVRISAAQALADVPIYTIHHSRF